jgi:hypothetical protein
LKINLLEQILDVKLEVKVFKYASEEEMNYHIEAMKKIDYDCVRKGQYILKPTSNIHDYSNEANWKYVAEFSRKEQEVSVNEPTSYESMVYWFNIYKPEKKEA